METLQRLADYFGVTVDYLVGNVNDPFFYLDNKRILDEINDTGIKKEPSGPAAEELSEEDRAFIAAFRAASPEKRRAILELLK